ncbi:MAG: hypothetical protein U5L72_14560 [Bacteroidales bacterium]|nr:hypothetical protein [Bacteroidales bacterium]
MIVISGQVSETEADFKPASAITEAILSEAKASSKSASERAASSAASRLDVSSGVDFWHDVKTKPARIIIRITDFVFIIEFV